MSRSAGVANLANMIEVAATCAAPRPSSPWRLQPSGLAEAHFEQEKAHPQVRQVACQKPTSEMTARPCGPAKRHSPEGEDGTCAKALESGTATANASSTAMTSRRAPALNNVANASPRKLFSRNAASGALKPHVAAKAPAVNAAARTLHFGRATALLTFDTSFVVNVGGGRGASAASVALCVVVGRSCGSAAAAPRRAAA